MASGPFLRHGAWALLARGTTPGIPDGLRPRSFVTGLGPAVPPAPVASRPRRLVTLVRCPAGQVTWAGSAGKSSYSWLVTIRRVASIASQMSAYRVVMGTGPSRNRSGVR